MSKRFIISVSVFLLAILGVAIFLFRDESDATKPLSRKALAKDYAEYAARSGQTNQPTQVVLLPLKLSEPVRLAVGGLGRGDDEKNRQLGDLVTVELSGAPGFALVERESLAKVLQELRLSWSGLVRANDAVRVGKLLRADWFLLGTEAKINGTNSMVARVVDARTGIIRDAGIFPADEPPPQLASDLAAFLRQVRQNAASAKLHVYLAIGEFEDLSVNDRRADFPSQLRGYITAAYRGSSVTLLERESVDILLQETHLDLASLTEHSGPNPAAAMQAAFWLVTGQYQSYETTNFQVEVNLEVDRIFGTTWQKNVRGAPGEPVGRQIKQAIDEVMNQNVGAIIPTRASEARIQMAIGRELFESGPIRGYDLVFLGSSGGGSDPQKAAKQKRLFEDAVRVFKTVLLLEPNHHEAKMYLAACMRTTLLLRPDEACNFYREIIDDPVQDKWSGLAQQALVETFKWFGPAERLAWLKSAASQTTNQLASAFYLRQIQAAETEAIIDAGDSPKAEEFAEQRLFESISSAEGYFHHKMGSPLRDHLGMPDYLEAVGRNGADAPRKLAELLPRMKKVAPDLEPFLVTSLLSFQPDTNTPVMAEFQAVLTDSTEHPKPDLNPAQLWADMGEIYYWCFAKTNYPLAVQLMEDERRVAAAGYTDFGDGEKIKLAYAYMAVARWQDALEIFEGYSNRPLPSMGSGPWGAAFQPIMTDKLAAFCHDKLGQPVQHDSRLFEMGKPVLCLCAPSAFIADDTGLWIGIGGRLLHLDFELKTNLEVQIPMNGSLPISALCLTAKDAWIGTAGDGLIEFNRASHHSRHFTEADGLLMNYLSSLQATENSLWIGYGSGTGGGLGQMDLRSGKLNSFTPSLNADSTAFTGKTPPRVGIGEITAGTDGDLWMLVAGAVRQFHVASEAWETLPNQPHEWVTCFSADADRLVEGHGIRLTELEITTMPAHAASTNEIKKTKSVVSMVEAARLEANVRTNGQHQRIYSRPWSIPPKGGLAIQNLRDHHWQNLEDADGLPNPPSALTLDGDNLWVGGEGAIALVDLKEGKVRKFCHIKAATVDRIQIAGGYVWAQFDWHLYRAPLSALQ